MKNLTFSFSALALACLFVQSTPASAECMAKYLAEINVQDGIARRLDDSGSDCTDKMYCLMPMVSTLGIPNMSATSKYMSATSKKETLSKAYRVIREAESGGGVHLIEFRDAIRNSEKGLKSVDLDYVSQAIREANNKEFFCASGVLVDVDQMKKIVISLL